MCPSATAPAAANDRIRSSRGGQTAALVGESGCGKSTITKLLLGLYRAESGTIRVGGQPVEALSLDYLRSQTAYVPQTTFLFSDTIRNNLLLGLTEAQMPSQEELERVLMPAAAAS